MSAPAHPVLPSRMARIRLLQTTDLHMQLLPFDYRRLIATQTDSLAHLRGPIDALRDEGIPSILVDTGDFLQGNALADTAVATDSTHPMIAAFNAMAYDAVVLGNHDFDFGLDALRNALGGLDCPVLAANLDVSDTAPLAVPGAIIPLDVDGLTIKVGLLGLSTAPPATVCNPATPPFVQFTNPLDIAADGCAALRTQGADIVVALCHFGIDPSDQVENVADKVAQIEGIDALFAGHTHDEFPGSDIPNDGGIDPERGRLHGKPCVMAGVFGRAIGKIDLTLKRDGIGWAVANADCEVVHPPASAVPPPLSVPGIIGLHNTTVARLRAPVTETHVPLSTAFNMIAPDRSQQLLAQARMDAVRAKLVDSTHDALPLIGTAAPYHAGMKDEPTLFLNVPPGELTKQDIKAIFPFQDPVIGLHQTGAQVAAWLEASARRFQTIQPGATRQPLIDTGFAPYDFKTMFGLTYVIDPSQPIGQRIQMLRYNGIPIRPADTFVVATTPNHLKGQDLSQADDVLCITGRASQEILETYLKDNGPVMHQELSTWRLAAIPNTSAQFVSTSSADLSFAPAGVTAGAPTQRGLQMYTYAFDHA